MPVISLGPQCTKRGKYAGVSEIDEFVSIIVCYSLTGVSTYIYIEREIGRERVCVRERGGGGGGTEEEWERFPRKQKNNNTTTSQISHQFYRKTVFQHDIFFLYFRLCIWYRSKLYCSFVSWELYGNQMYCEYKQMALESLRHVCGIDIKPRYG